jgi:hypothetical protein
LDEGRVGERRCICSARDRTVEPPTRKGERSMEIKRISPGPPDQRCRRARRDGLRGTGQVADDASVGVKGQTGQILKKIDELLAQAGSDKSKIQSPTNAAVARASGAGLADRVDDVEGRDGEAPLSALSGATMSPAFAILDMPAASARGDLHERREGDAMARNRPLATEIAAQLIQEVA